MTRWKRGFLILVMTVVFLILSTEYSQQRNYAMSSVHSNNCYWLRWLLSLKHYWSDHSTSTSLISRQCGECEGVRLEPGPAWVLSNIFMLQLHFFRNYWSFWVTFRLSWAQFFPQHSPPNLSLLSWDWEDTSKPSLDDVTLNISPLGTNVIIFGELNVSSSW